MRHGKKNIKLGRKTAHRKAMLANMAISLFEHKRITTSSTKAKALKIFIEPLITKSKNDNVHNRRLCFSKLRNKVGVQILFDEISKKIADRPGGYTRIIKLGNRLGDNASMAMIELVDFNNIYTNNTSSNVTEAPAAGSVAECTAERHHSSQAVYRGWGQVNASQQHYDLS